MKMKPIWIDQTTYRIIIEQLKKHGEIIIEAMGYEPIFLKGCVKDANN